LALMCRKAEYTTSKVTQHLVTNGWVVGKFLPAKLVRQGELEQRGMVAVVGRGQEALNF